MLASSIASDRQQAVHELEDLQTQLDAEASGRANQERLTKQYELQLSEIQAKCDEQSRQVSASMLRENVLFVGTSCLYTNIAKMTITCIDVIR